MKNSLMIMGLDTIKIIKISLAGAVLKIVWGILYEKSLDGE
tara:strand:+ start:116 stop:238 length:123 start_codon:yes stop_codon:yes gene_type:complete